MSLVSIVVPVYNTEKYLKKCIDSLVSQSYKELEIILVDDGSTDNSGAICDELALADLRIKVIHKKNGGLSSSRESGILAANGEFIMIVDSDDWIDLETVEMCVNRMEKANADCVMFSYVKEYPEKSIPMQIMDGDKSLLGKDAEDKVYRRLFGLLDEELAHPERMENVVSCCMKLYRCEFAKKARYFDTKEVGSAEDALFNMYALHGTKKIEYIDKPYYHYLKNPKSLTNSYRPLLVSQWNRLFDIMTEIIEEKHLGERYKNALNNRIALSIIGIGMNELGNENISLFKQMKSIGNYLKSERYKKAIKGLPINQLPFIWRIFIYCCKIRFSLAVYCMLLAMQILKKRG